jgi:hypothetical protein
VKTVILLEQLQIPSQGFGQVSPNLQDIGTGSQGSQMARVELHCSLVRSQRGLLPALGVEGKPKSVLSLGKSRIDGYGQAGESFRFACPLDRLIELGASLTEGQG